MRKRKTDKQRLCDKFFSGKCFIYIPPDIFSGKKNETLA